MTILESVRKERAATTRAALIRAARQLFARNGYHAAGTHELVASADVTRGALYHHFQDKAALFEAVFHQVEEELLSEAAAAVADLAGDARRQLTVGLEAYLRVIAGRADMQRILLLDGPVVLGWSRWRELQSGFTLGLIIQSLERSILQGSLRSQPVTPMAHLIFAALNEAALLIAHSENAAATQVEVSTALLSMVEGLR
jgi:AcrR family transcriptional regulator